MSHPLIDRNDDLRTLRDEGYAVGISGANLVVEDIPYVTATGTVRRDGVIVAPIVIGGDVVGPPDTHVVFFAGDMPHTRDGHPVASFGASPHAQQITPTRTTSFQFSAKPTSGQYESHTRKIRTYTSYICSHAAALEPDTTPLTRRVVPPDDDTSPFCYLDTASARAEINMITAKLAIERVAIVGTGGTGSYVLDLVAKTPVNEIHLFDGDVFSSHNAFRAPGAASIEELRAQPYKVDYLRGRYSVLHKRIVAHPQYIDSTNVDSLRDMRFVFLCIDSNPAKRLIVQSLEDFGITFIDVGMGLFETNATIGGILRVTTSQADNRLAARANMSLDGSTATDLYERNIQVADLNMLNATLAVQKWKKLMGFYQDTARERQLLYTVRSNLVTTDVDHESD